ncbi:MAG: amino acid ABC transporter permease [Thermodesulfobacteriota bacterium]
MDDTLSFLVERVVPGLNLGLWATVQLAVPSAIFGLLAGIAVGVIRVYGPRPAQRLANGYVALFRGTPLVVQLFCWYFGLPQICLFIEGLPPVMSALNAAGLAWVPRLLVLSPMGAAILGFALCSGAYHSEYVRGGLMSIRAGQVKAAQALGMSPWQTVLHVVLPQAVRRALPGCGNEIIYLVKYSSLASVITVNELTGTARGIAKATWRNTEVFFAVGVYYLLLVTLATFILGWVEERLSLPGFERRRE